MKSSSKLTTDAKPEGFKYNIQVLEKALHIFELIAQSQTPVTIQELQDATNLNRTTIWRILSTMIDSGFLTQFQHNKSYCLSCKACNLIAASSASSIALIECARPEMERLRQISGESVLLLVPEVNGTRTILQLNSFENVRIKDYTNEVTPLFATSTGIVQLSALTDEEIQIVIPDILPAYTEFTPTDKDKILQRIANCRRDGYAYIIDEFERGDSGLSVPITLNNLLVGILNISAPTMRFSEERILSLIPEIKSSALHIAHSLSL